MNYLVLARCLMLVMPLMVFEPSIAQIKTTVVDQNASFKFEVNSESEWAFDSGIDKGRSVTCATNPETEVPLLTLCVTTKIKPNDLAVKIPSLAIAQQKTFIKGVCVSYQCRDESGVISSEELIEKTYGDVTGFEFVSELKHPGYVESKLSDTIFFVTSTPSGQVQLFSLHAAPGKAQDHRGLFEHAIKTVEYSAAD